MNDLAEKIDGLLIRQGDIFVEQLRELISSELANAISRQFGVSSIETQLWPPEAGTPSIPCCKLGQS